LSEETQVNTTLSALAALFLTLSVAAPALAQQKPPPRFVPPEPWTKSEGSRFGVEADVLSNSYQAQRPEGVFETSRLALGLTVVGQFKLFAGLHLDLEAPGAFADVSGRQYGNLLGDEVYADGDHSALVFGNPMIGLHYAGHLRPTLVLFGGLAGSIPILQDPGLDTRIAAAVTVPARGHFDAHRLLLEYLSFRARFGTEIRMISVLYYRGDVTGMLAFPTGEGGETRSVIEVGNEIELRALGGFGLGMRLQAAFPLSAKDGAQTAAEPFVSYEPNEKGSYLRAGFLVALDEDLGFGLDPGKVATIRVALGGKF
jgi:hypothetical protein